VEWSIAYHNIESSVTKSRAYHIYYYLVIVSYQWCH
jgi:hypothetical protein